MDLQQAAGCGRTPDRVRPDGGAIALNSGRPDTSGRCILATGAWGWVSPGQFRVVATDYQWIAKCNATLIALETSGSFHNVRFVKGSDGCAVSVEQLPP